MLACVRMCARIILFTLENNRIYMAFYVHISSFSFIKGKHKNTRNLIKVLLHSMTMTLLLVEWLADWLAHRLLGCVRACFWSTHTFVLIMASACRMMNMIQAETFIKWKYLCIIKQIANRDNVWLLSTGETNDDSLCTAICRRSPLHIRMRTHTEHWSNMFCQQQPIQQVWN